MQIHCQYMQKETNIWVLVSSKAVYVFCGSWWSQTKWLDVSKSSLKVLSMWELKTKRQRWGDQNYVQPTSDSQSKQLLSLNSHICGSMDPTMCCRDPTDTQGIKKLHCLLEGAVRKRWERCIKRNPDQHTLQRQ